MCYYSSPKCIEYIPIYINNNKEFVEYLYYWSCAIFPTISILISGITYYVINRKNEKSEILKINDSLLDIGIQYPYLEDDSYCSSWDGNILKDDKSLRYHLYCCKVYNLIVKLFEYCHGNAKKMSNILDYDDYLKTHRKWMQTEADKTDNSKLNIFIHNRIKILDGRIHE